MRLESALFLARKGFYVFPCVENSKKPAVSDWPNKATRDETQIQRWWADRDYNIGIATAKYKDDLALVVVDIDTKGEKRGDETFLALELEGAEFPSTFEQSTPSGGRHLVYVCEKPLKQGVDVLGSGIDIRSAGGYIVAPYSQIDGGQYVPNSIEPIAAPSWFVDKLCEAKLKPATKIAPLPDIDPKRATQRAIKYIEVAPVAKEGEGGDITTFKVAAKLKDLGCTREEALFLLDEFWNFKCEPPWYFAELEAKVANVYRYGKEPQGSAAPEAQFEAVPDTSKAQHPFEKLNNEFAFVKKGAFILQETTNDKGEFVTEHLNMAEFHGWFANKMFSAGKDKPKPISTEWISWTGRREYEAIVFRPEEDVGERWYNLWRGFSVNPSATSDHPAVKQFLEHALKNVCAGDVKLCNWLIGYFAHMVQKPWEKPLVALVFKGKTGCNGSGLKPMQIKADNKFCQCQ